MKQIFVSAGKLEVISLNDFVKKLRIKASTTLDYNRCTTSGPAFWSEYENESVSTYKRISPDGIKIEGTVGEMFDSLNLNLFFQPTDNGKIDSLDGLEEAVANQIMIYGDPKYIVDFGQNRYALADPNDFAICIAGDKVAFQQFFEGRFPSYDIDFKGIESEIKKMEKINGF